MNIKNNNLIIIILLLVGVYLMYLYIDGFVNISPENKKKTLENNSNSIINTINPNNKNTKKLIDASKNTASQNTASQNTASQNTASKNTASKNTASQNAASQYNDTIIRAANNASIIDDSNITNTAINKLNIILKNDNCINIGNPTCASVIYNDQMCKDQNNPICIKMLSLYSQKIMQDIMEHVSLCRLPGCDPLACKEIINNCT